MRSEKIGEPCQVVGAPGEQVPDGLLQPSQVQHGRAQAPEEAEGQESHTLIDVAGFTLRNKDLNTFVYI